MFNCKINGKRVKLKNFPALPVNKNDPFIKFMNSMDRVTSSYRSDFRFFNVEDCPCKGILHIERNISYVYLPYHDVLLSDVLNTIEHEDIHRAIRHELHGEDDESYSMDIDDEHNMIRKRFHIEEYVLLDSPPPLEDEPLYDDEDID